VRIGGIYALERIARDSPRDHPTIMEVLAAFVREHSRAEWPKPAEDGAELPERRARPDVQAAVTVIGRRTIRHDSQPVDLESADLTRANLRGADLSGATMPVQRATFNNANLSGANLSGADLGGGVRFNDASLSYADLSGANLRYADLHGAFINDATFTRADLGDADLTEAKTRDADFSGARLSGVRWSSNTRVPPGWRRDADSGRLRRAAGDSGDAATE
jgi:hypothetical protein